jgi:hypothetical protein
MSVHRRVVGFAVLAAAAFALSPGCGGGSTPSLGPREEATVKGKVTLDGKPLTEGTVYFSPPGLDQKRAETTIGKDGSYTIKTVSGPNSVSLGSKSLAKHRGLNSYIETCDVKPGADNSFDVTLKSK